VEAVASAVAETWFALDIEAIARMGMAAERKRWDGVEAHIVLAAEELRLPLVHFC